MKTLKRIAPLLFAVMLGALLMGAPLLAYADMEADATTSAQFASGHRVLDQGGLLDSSQIEELENLADQVYSKHDIAPYYVTVDSLETYKDAESYTDDFIDAYRLGRTASGGCVVLLVCLPENQFAILSAGGAESTFTNDVLEHFIDEINPYLGRADWAGAGETFYDDISQTMSGKTANATSDVAYNGTYVTDDYGLFSDEQRTTLEATATKLAQDYNMGVYLLVVDYMRNSSGDAMADPSSSQRTNFATSFYRANNLGLGSGKDGIMLVIAVDSRDYVTIAYGQGSYSFSDEGIAAMESAVTDELGDNYWYSGCEAYYTKIGEQLEYYSVKGEPWTEPDFLSLILKILAILGIPAGVAFGKVNSEKHAMKTAREQTEASSYLVPGSFTLTGSSDKFVNTTLTKTPIPKHESSDSGGGFGGGGWGGGGGGGFSSSGGGKF